MNDRNNLKYKILSRQQLIPLLITLLISVLTALKNLRFLMLGDVMNISEQITILGLMATGATILIISKSFDISVRAVTGLSLYLMAMIMNAGIPTLVTAAADIFVAMFCAFFDGVFAILFKASSLIVSLVATSVCTGAALYLAKGVIQTVYEKFSTVNRFHLFEAIPLTFTVSLIGCVVTDIMLRYTQIGRYIFAIGSNGKTAFLSGIKMIRDRLIFFALNGFSVGLVAVLLLSRVGLVLSSTEAGYGPQAMGATIIGGTSISGGKGNTVGTFFGILLMGFISNVLNILGVNPCLQEVVSGALIVIPLGIGAIRVHMLTRSQGGL